jgi:hypothetical protein
MGMLRGRLLGLASSSDCATPSRLHVTESYVEVEELGSFRRLSSMGSPHPHLWHF